MKTLALRHGVGSPEIKDVPQGFRFSAVSAGLKASGRLDLALVQASAETRAAALFTQNRVVAAPIEFGRSHLASTRGRVCAVIVNAGNANCATGKEGMRGCQRTCEEVARLMGLRREEVFPSSTGIIGVPFPVDKIIANLPRACSSLEETAGAVDLFSQAIMTTDTQRKFASAQFESANKQVKLLGIAKGSGMIHPQLATMLVYLFSDVAANPIQLKRCLREASEGSFNSISVDGDTSTNDTVLLLASGKSGIRIEQASTGREFSNALRYVCNSLAAQILRDGEGVKRVIRLTIKQAKNRKEGLQVARAVAHSLLVKTAWAGADPNWGRILAAIGRSGVPVDSSKISITIEDQLVCKAGQFHPFDQAKAHEDLARATCNIGIKLNRGGSTVVFTTTDLSEEYVRINADYST
ncbi:MAG: bifunctional glutamate N-acetyltransferase/amino-acid acetyltransferase ArgJ [Terriglobales bacterium]